MRKSHREATRIRQYHGSLNHKAKLTEAEIPVIRQLVDTFIQRDGMTRMAARAAAAEKFEVSLSTITKIHQGVTWVHV
jgi:hypothetical protein